MAVPTYDRFIEPIRRFLAAHPDGAAAKDVHAAAAASSLCVTDALGRTNDDLPPAVSTDSVSAQEGTTTAVLTIALDSPSGRTARVDYPAADGTATPAREVDTVYRNWRRGWDSFLRLPAPSTI